jgi:hypothetical protein
MPEDIVRSMSEVELVPWARDRKSSNGNTVDLLDARRQLISPRDVVLRPCRQHLDVGASRQEFGDVTRESFGSAADVRAVALNNNRELH